MIHKKNRDNTKKEKRLFTHYQLLTCSILLRCQEITFSEICSNVTAQIIYLQQLNI